MTVCAAMERLPRTRRLWRVWACAAVIGCTVAIQGAAQEAPPGGGPALAETQGEVFGKNNDAGVINIVTKRPSTTFGVTAEATYGNFDEKEISASVTGPIGDMSAARFYAGYQKRNGCDTLSDGLGPSTDNRANDRNVSASARRMANGPSSYGVKTWRTKATTRWHSTRRFSLSRSRHSTYGITLRTKF